MGRPADEHALLIEMGDAVRIELARNLLAEAGIPCLVHGGDFDVAELGTAVHHALRRRDLYVPGPLLERARGVLEAAWGTLDEPAGDSPRAHAP